MDDDLGLKIPIFADTNPFSQAMGQVKDKVSSAVGGIKDAIGAAGLLAIGYLKGAIESAGKAEESTARLKTQIENQGLSWDKVSKQVSSFTSGISKMSDFTGGQAKEALTELTSKGVKLGDALKMQNTIVDLAVGKNMDLTSASDVLADAYNGKTRALLSLGLATKEEIKNGISFDEVQKRINERFGGSAAAELNTYNGQLKQTQNYMNSVKTTIGSALLPYLSQIAQKLNLGAQAVAKFATEHKQLLAGILSVTAVLGTLIGGVGLFQKVLGILGPAVTGISGLIGGLTLPVIAVIGSIAALTIAYTNNWGGIKDKTDAAVKFIKPLIIDSFNSVVTWFKTNWPAIKEKFEEVLHGIESAYNTVLKPILTFMIQEIGKVVQWVQVNWPLIKETVQTVMNFVWSLISTILGKISSFWEAHGKTIITIVKNDFDIIKTVIDTVIHVVLDIITAVMDIITGNWKGAWNKIVDAVKTIFHGAIQIVKDILGNIGAAFEDMIKTAWNWGANLINGFIDGVKSKISAVKDAVSSVTSAVAGFLGFHSPSKEGEGQHIVEWGQNMVKGFSSGIRSQIPSLQALMNTVIQAPSFSSGIGSMALAGVGSSNVSNSNSYSVTIDAKNVKEFNDVVNICSNLKQIKRAR